MALLHGLRKSHSPRELKRFVTGHDFSGADKANQIAVGIQPLQKQIPKDPP
jgi:hypothetical protein